MSWKYCRYMDDPFNGIFESRGNTFPHPSLTSTGSSLQGLADHSLWVSLHRLQFTDHNISVDKSEVVSNVGEVSHLLHPPLGMPLAPHPSSPSMLVAHLAGGNQVTVSPKHLTVHPDASLWKITLWVYLILLINFNWFQIHLGAYKKPETYGIHIARLFWKTFYIM